MVLILSPVHDREMARWSRSSYPMEACGLLIGRVEGDRAVAVRCEASPNTTDGDPRRRFSIAPEILLNAQRRARAEALAIIGVFHSHPDRPPAPSKTDLDQAWPGLLYVIGRTDRDACGPLTAWRLNAPGHGFEEIPIVAAPVSAPDAPTPGSFVDDCTGARRKQ